MSKRLSIAVGQGDLPLPDAGFVRVFGARADSDLSALPSDRVEVVQPFKPDFDALTAGGYACAIAPTEDIAALSIVFLPRSKALALSWVAQAAASTRGLVVVDGNRTDGIDSTAKALRGRVRLAGSLSKAHGKLVWFAAVAQADLADLVPPQPPGPAGFHTVPGVFSADAVDPASALLAGALPDAPGARLADLGAGWGYLSARILARARNVAAVHLVEADVRALDCARANVSDPRATFHWADARDWTPPEPLDGVVMNPPFHTGRSADPGLGRSFIAAAARILAPRGRVWLVANRHLPYEAEMRTHFARVEEIAGTPAFKVLTGHRASRTGR